MARNSRNRNEMLGSLERQIGKAAQRSATEFLLGEGAGFAAKTPAGFAAKAAIKPRTANPAELAEVTPGATPKPMDRLERAGGGKSSPLDFLIRPAVAGKDTVSPGEQPLSSEEFAAKAKPQQPGILSKVGGFINKATAAAPIGVASDAIGGFADGGLAGAARAVGRRFGSAAGGASTAVSGGSGAVGTAVEGVREGFSEGFSGTPAGQAPIELNQLQRTDVPRAETLSPAPDNIRKDVTVGEDGKTRTSFSQVGNGTVTQRDVLNQFGGNPIGFIDTGEVRPGDVEGAARVSRRRAAENRRLAETIRNQRRQFIADEQEGRGNPGPNQVLAKEGASAAEAAKAYSDIQRNAQATQQGQQKLQLEYAKLQQKAADGDAKARAALGKVQKQTQDNIAALIEGAEAQGRLNLNVFPGKTRKEKLQAAARAAYAAGQNNAIDIGNNLGEYDINALSPAGLNAFVNAYAAAQQGNQRASRFLGIPIAGRDVDNRNAVRFGREEGTRE